MATRKATPAPEAEAPASEGESKSTKVRASDVLESVFEAIQAAGPDGISMTDLEAKTGLRYRVLHNVTWHLGEKLDTPRIRRVGDGRKLVFASVEAAKPAPSKRATRKPASKATAKKAA